MDDPLIALLFAEDLTRFVLSEHGLELPAETGIARKTNVSKSRFNSVVGLCVMDLISRESETIRKSYEKLLRRNVRTVQQFRFEATVSAIFHFREGYDPELFLNLAAMLIGLAALYARDGNGGMAIGASQVMAYVLNFYIYHANFNTRIGWFDLAIRAQNVRRCLFRMKVSNTVNS